MNNKKGKLNYYLPYEIILKNDNQSDFFQFFMYYGLFNQINCFINFNGVKKYSCEHFYYNSNFLVNFPNLKLK